MCYADRHVAGRLLAEKLSPYRNRENVIVLGLPRSGVVDDGLATGSTMKAAVAALRKQGPKRLIVAVPVGANETCAKLREEVDEVVCAMQPQNFMAVGLWYQDFSPTSDAAVQSLLAEASEWQHATAGQ